MSKNAKKLIPGCCILLLLIGFGLALPYILPIFAFGKWDFSIKNFSDYQQDFERVATFCSDYIAKKRQNDPDAPNWISYNSPNHQLKYVIKDSDGTLSSEILELDANLQASVERISQAFYYESYLNVIRCYEDGSVYFETEINYAIAYCPTGKPYSRFSYITYDYKKAAKHWYHVVGEYTAQDQSA